jgi:hypothetical protein
MPSTASSVVNIGDNILATQHNNLRDDAQAFMLKSSNEVTISTGTITLTSGQTRYSIDTQNNAATDDLDTINGGSEGIIIVLIPENVSHVVTVKHNTGNIILGCGDCILGGANDSIMLIRGPSTWIELNRSPRTGGDIPTGLISLRDTSCPSGWTRFSALDGKLPRGAASYSGTPFGTSTHSHVYTDVIAHTHAVGSLTVTTDGAHTHNLYWYDASGDWGKSYKAGGSTDNTYTSGIHNHTISGCTASTGSASPSSSSSSHVPPYRNMIFCKRD